MISKLEAAKKEESPVFTNERKHSMQYIKKFRQAFFDIIIELFMNYKNSVEDVNGETVFNAKQFFDDSEE